MRLSIPFEAFSKTRTYYEYIHRVIAPKIDHKFDGKLIWELLNKYRGPRPKRRYEGAVMKLYRILTPVNFQMGYPLSQAYNPAARLQNGGIELLVRAGSFNPGRTFLARVCVDDFGKGYLNDESLIPDKVFRARLFLRARLPYESVEDPRFSPVGIETYVVSVLRGPGLPISEPVITWLIRGREVAPIMYEDIVLSDNRDTFRATEKLIAIRPNYKFTPGTNVTALAYISDEPNVVEKGFTLEPFIRTKDEEKTGGGFSFKLGSNEYGIVFHVVYRGERGLKGEGTAGVYINYLAVIDNHGNLLGYTERPLTPIDYPYSGQRPGAVFASGGFVIAGETVYRLFPDINEHLADFGKLFVLFAGIDDEAMAVFVQDLDKVLEAVMWK